MMNTLLMVLRSVLFFQILFLSSIVYSEGRVGGYQMRLPSPEVGTFKLLDKDPCEVVVPVDPKQLKWPYPGTPPWYAEPDTKVFNDTIVTGLVDSLKAEIVPGLPDTFEEVFGVFQKAGCRLYIHGGCVRDFLLGLFPKDIDIEYSCDPSVLKKACIEAYGADQCHFKDSGYFYVGKRESSSQFEELEGVNWNGTIFGPPFTKEYTTNALSYDLNGNDIIIDIVGTGTYDTCFRLIRIPVPESKWREWMTESYYIPNNGIKKLPRFWKLRATPKLYFPADNSTLPFILSNVEQLWKNSTYPVEKTFRKFYCGMVNGTVASDGSGCYVDKVPSKDIIDKMQAYNVALEKDMGSQWYNSSVIDANVNKIIIAGVKTISNCQELQNMSEDLNGNYALINDIYCSDTKNWNGKAGFIPIQNFNGKLNGGNYKIANLHIDNSMTHNVGLFGSTGNSSQITNVILENADIYGNGDVGGLVGQNHGYIAGSSVIKSTVSAVGVGNFSSTLGALVGENREKGIVTNSRSSGKVVMTGSCGNNSLGGLIGGNYEGTISNSFSEARVLNNETYISGCASNTGGFLGGNSRNGQVYNSDSTGAVFSNGGDAGGFMGINNGLVSSSFATGDVNNKNGLTGGFVGYNYNDLGVGNTTISDCYATGDVSGNQSVGGLVGVNWTNCTIKNSYSVGKVSGSGTLGGLVGSLLGGGGVVTNSFYNKETSEQNDTGKGEPKTTAEMMQQSTFVGWDFNSIWKINEDIDYPRLRWQRDTPPAKEPYWLCAAWQQCNFKKPAIANHAYSVMLLGCNHNPDDSSSSVTYIRDCSENTGTPQYGATHIKCGAATYNDLGIAGDSVTCNPGEEIAISSEITKGQMIGSMQLIPTDTNGNADPVNPKGHWLCAGWQQCNFKKPAIANYAYSVMLLGCNHNPTDSSSSVTYIRDCSESTGTPQYGITHIKCGSDTTYNDLGIAGDSVTCKPGEEVVISSEITKGQMIGSIQLIPT